MTAMPERIEGRGQTGNPHQKWRDPRHSAGHCNVSLALVDNLQLGDPLSGLQHPQLRSQDNVSHNIECVTVDPVSNVHGPPLVLPDLLYQDFALFLHGIMIVLDTWCHTLLSVVWWYRDRKEEVWSESHL